MSSRCRLNETAAALLAFAAALASIVAITWPWILHFDGEFLRHWDPPFHAWKLEFMARRILAGDIFMSSGNTNMLYPHSGALYFEALQWPMAVLAAPLFALTPLHSELIYHVTLVFFWSLSAPCMLLLLRTLGCRQAAAVAGSVVFCILPWRISYMVEFQMEMVFALPLFFAFIVRFFKSLRASDAVLAVFSWWLLAVSELYEAVFAAMAAPVVALAFVVASPSVLSDRRFWRAVLVAALVGGVSVCILLLPYATLHSDGQVMRPIKEVVRHSAHPLSYLVPYGRNAFYALNAHCDEFSLYPTATVALLVLCGAIWRLWRDAAGRRWAAFSFATMAIASGLMFYGLAMALQFNAGAQPRHLPHLMKYSSQIFLFSSAAYAFASVRGESGTAIFLKALLAVSVFFLFLSFGPIVSFGAGRLATMSFPNTIYVFSHRRLLPFLSGFRVVSRFGVIVLTFLVCASTVTLDALARRLKGRSGAFARLAAAVAFVALVAIEAIPRRRLVSSYLEVDDQRKSPAVARLVERHPYVTMAALPCGPREIENMRMFTLLKGDWPYIYAWGGFFPEYSERLMRTLMSLDAGASHRELSRLYPPCLILVDNGIPVHPRGPVPRRYLSDEDETLVDFGKFCADFADEVDSDGRFSIFRLRPQPPSERATKIFRSDIARRNPLLNCSALARPGARVAFTLNGKDLGEAAVGDDGAAWFSCTVPFDALTEKPFNEIAAVTDDGSPLSFTDFVLGR